MASKTTVLLATVSLDAAPISLDMCCILWYTGTSELETFQSPLPGGSACGSWQERQSHLGTSVAGSDLIHMDTLGRDGCRNEKSSISKITPI
jgi:hypothetical protein